MKRFDNIIFVFLFSLTANPLFSQVTIFHQVPEYRPWSHQSSFLGPIDIRCQMPYISPFYRNYNDRAPGDYFYSPHGGDTIPLSHDDLNEIKTILRNINQNFYDSLILNQITAFRYSICDGPPLRYEYYIRYGLGDTIFVISGWLRKFLSFYRAIPGDFRYSIAQFQNEVRKFSPIFKEIPGKSIRQDSLLNEYFLEYVNSNQMIRAWNYEVVEEISHNRKTGQSETKTYNLIEITKFIDKEVMP